MKHQLRSSKGQASIQEDKGRLRIRFPRELFDGKVKVMSLNLPATKDGYTEARHRLSAIQADIDFGTFDPTLASYQKQSKKPKHLQQVTDLYPDIELMDLWLRYFNYKKPMLKESTIQYYEVCIARTLEKSKFKSPYQALELREWLLNNTTESMAKRVLTYVNAAFNWGLKHRLVKGLNPYDGMPTELKHNYQLSTTPNAFTLEEREKILESFKNHSGNWNGRGYTGKTYQHYYNFVRFLFLSGCRPHEAIGLCWGNVSQDFKKVTFDGGIFQAYGKRIRTKKSKNNKVRSFPCNLELQTFLESIKPDGVTSDDLVFPSPNGKPINYGNFSKNAWDAIVDPIKPGTTPYCCRDTFITEQIAKGVNPAIIGKWADTSTGMIEKHYLDSMNLAHILPQ
ncbi:integrase [Aphanothece hegewaldii CCALA 016]|uniref:Integrase n=1 Tax=Aphanothece hegewaldii CCALA 016 TaxID=2107694 RepID=A0A2T1LZG6_9CHRO|nr:tyrosine-type recombinase/integrase [Aphanothece hegewaldii]PSF37773.1 integrase [Aphanothece hegewaldii CCALA 016]